MTINHDLRADEEDEDLLEYEERKDMVDELISNPINRKSLLQMRQKKAGSALSSKRSSSAKKLQEINPAGTVEEKLEEAGSTKSLLSKKDYDEIRTIVRQQSQKEASQLSKKSESVLSVKGESAAQRE